MFTLPTPTKSRKKSSSNKKKMMEEASFSEPELTNPSNSSQDPYQNPRKKRSDNTKRFSDEQVKSLESMFHKGAKLEPRSKLQLAKDLGLQPRQVSIWFQNKRARWKSKKMEQEYSSLQASYDSLYQQYGCLKNENESLREQLDRLKTRLENSTCNQSSSKDSNENAMNTNEAQPHTEQNSEHEESHEKGINSNVGMEITTYEYCREQGQEEPESFTFSDQEDSWKVSRKQWFVPNGILDDPSCSSNWWDF